MAQYKSTCCSCGGPGFNFQHPHGSSQPYITPGQGDTVPVSNLCKDQAVHAYGAQMCKQATHIHTYTPIKQKQPPTHTQPSNPPPTHKQQGKNTLSFLFLISIETSQVMNPIHPPQSNRS